jgi:hypothetical protein
MSVLDDLVSGAVEDQRQREERVSLDFIEAPGS